MTAELPVDAAELRTFLSAELEADVVGTEVLHDGLNLAVALSTPAADPHTSSGARTSSARPTPSTTSPRSTGS